MIGDCTILEKEMLYISQMTKIFYCSVGKTKLFTTLS